MRVFKQLMLGTYPMILIGKLSPYSLAPQVWNHAKAMMGKLRVRNKENMFNNMKSILHSIQKKTALIKSFFKMQHTKYILDAQA